MTNKSSMLAVVLGALLSGCASDAQVQTKLDAPTNAEVCCSDFSQYPYAQLNDNEDLKENDIALLAGFGVGYSWGAVAIKFN
mgnify:CR=1 FL=1